MFDVLYIIVSLLMFAALIAFTVGCEHIIRRDQ